MTREKAVILEDNLSLMLNNKKIKELTDNLKNLIHNCFGYVDDNETVYCVQPDKPIKPDIIVTVKGETHYISIKSENAGFVHEEFVEDFIEYLRSLNISENSIKVILLHQFGDGTTDGTGKERLSTQEVFSKYYNDIQKVNLELNDTREIRLTIIDRILFKGNIPNAYTADFIYFGNIDYGIVVSRDQILKHMYKYRWPFLEMLHIGPMFISPHARYAKTEIRNEKYRHRIQFYWKSLGRDLKYISLHYSNSIQNKNP